MKLSLVLQVFAAVAFTTATDVTPPACALPCINAAVPSSGCTATDYICQCTTGRTAIFNSIVPCLTKSKCSNADYAQLQVFSAEFCPKILSSASSAGTATATPTSSNQTKSTGSPTTSSSTSKAVSQAGSATSSSTPTSSTKPSSGHSNRGSTAEVFIISSFAIACIVGLSM